MMRLRRLDLARFGHFTDQVMDFGARPQDGSDFHIVYGANEAGKTTTMEGYLRLLYGFPGKDPYAFKHQRANLSVAGTLEIDGVARSLTRLSRRSANLLDDGGNALPETVLQSALGGLSMEDYRKLLCLDDETIETGGDEITRSKGDIGRLLFSAAAGISDLSEVLDDAETRLFEIYRKGGSKSEFAALKREHDQVSQDIKEHDISASAYRALRDAHEDAQAQEAELRRTKADLTLRQVRLKALIDAYPLAARLRGAERDLAPVSHYPNALDIDPETLVSMMTARVGLCAKRDRAKADLSRLQEQKQALAPRPALLALLAPLAGLSALKSRVETAALDLPRRRAALSEALEKMGHRLDDLGLEANGDPTRFVLAARDLGALERHLDAIRDSENAAATAQGELRDATRKHSDAEWAQENAQAALSVGPEPGALLVRFDAQALFERYTAARTDLARADRQAAARRRKLTRLDVVFDRLPGVAMTAVQAAALAGRIDRGEQALSMAEEAAQGAARDLKRAQLALEQASTRPGLISDADADQSRRQRDAFWLDHRAALSGETAERFHAAMQQDDTNQALRAQQAGALAEHRQALISEADARLAQDEAVQARDTAKAALSDLQTRLSAALAECGLPAQLLAAEFAEWVRDLEEAAQEQGALDALIAEHADTMAQAGALHEALAALLDEADAPLEVLMERARALNAQHGEEQQALQKAADDLTREARELERRKAALQETGDRHKQARQDWDDRLAQVLPDTVMAADPADILRTLRELRELNEGVSGLQRQIDGMEQDITRFEGEMSALAARAGITPDTAPLETFAQIDEAVKAAQRIADLIEQLDAQIAEEQDAQDQSEAALATLDAQTRDLASVFDPAIATATLEDLRAAVMTAREAIRLRDEARAARQQLLALLDVATLDAAEAALQATSAEQAGADLQMVKDDIARSEQDLDRAIEQRTTADLALKAVVGDGEIAILSARKRTIEARMEAALLRYLEGRFGHDLADQAIRRYRDTHRSAMMAATERAFAALTNGAYSALTTQPGAGAGGETLLAIQASDLVAKDAAALSKGTRFQLYLALRAAAYDQMAENGTILPFFCDDVFETFDEERTRAACGLMHRIGQTGQAIYLTHHRHVVDIAREVCGDQVRVHNL